jgi:hypothetical protein
MELNFRLNGVSLLSATGDPYDPRLSAHRPNLKWHRRVSAYFVIHFLGRGCFYQQFHFLLRSYFLLYFFGTLKASKLRGESTMKKTRQMLFAIVVLTFMVQCSFGSESGNRTQTSGADITLGPINISQLLNCLWFSMTANR